MLMPAALVDSAATRDVAAAASCTTRDTSGSGIAS